MKKLFVFSILALGLVAGLVAVPNLVSAQTSTQDGCYGWNAYSVTTGQKCVYNSTDSSNLPAGCTSTEGYSPLTGVKCDSNSGSSLPPGCQPGDLFSRLTGQRCITATPSSGPVISGVSGPQQLKVGETGTWTVQASGPTGSTLSYSVDWGENAAKGCAINSPCPTTATSSQQNATFTHSYSSAGTYTVSFTVQSSNTIQCFVAPCQDNSGTAKTSITVKVGDIATPSVTVLSPNGGETWVKDTAQLIKWRENSICISNQGQTCPSRYVDIKLVPYSKPCSSDFCTMTAIHDPYIITSYRDISDGNISWNVGRVVGNADAVYDGLYTIQICVSGSTTDCDSSDSYFKITHSSSSGPTISGVSGPQQLNVNQTGTWTVNASDSSGGTLSYSVDWGETPDCTSGICHSSIEMHNLMQSQSATFTHSYASAGTYTPTFTVTNSAGQTAQTSLSVQVIKYPQPVANLQAVMGTPSYSSTTDPSGNVTSVTYVIPLSLTASGGTLYMGQVVKAGDDIYGKDAIAFSVEHSVLPTTHLNSISYTTQALSTSDASIDNLGYKLDNGVTKHFTITVILNRFSNIDGLYRVVLNKIRTFTDANLQNEVMDTTLYPEENFQTGYQFLSGTPSTSSLPKITSVVPTVLEIGQSLTIYGSNLNAGGYPLVWLSQQISGAPEKKGLLPYSSPSPTKITATVPSSLCTVNVSASGAPCPSYISTPIGDNLLLIENANGVSNYVNIRVMNAALGQAGLPIAPANALDAFNSATGTSSQTVEQNKPAAGAAGESCSFSATLWLGMRGREVKCLQQYLNTKGFKVAGTEGGKETEYFGMNTFTALKNFQSAKGLSADGVFGPKTQAALAR